MRHEVTAVHGDSPTTFRRVQQVLATLGAPLDWDEPSSDATDADMLASVRRTGVALVGHRAPEGSELPPAVVLRDELGVFAQHRPIRPLPGLPARHPDANLLVVRETTEDVYAHLEHESIPGVFESLKVTTRAACERIARHAFEVARRTGRHKVTVVHKANIMKLSDGLFLRTALQVAREFPDIEVEDVIVDALCMKVVIRPDQFDVLLCGNLFGDIVGDLAAGLVGGESNAPSINYAEGAVLFTAGHGDPVEDRASERSNPLPVLLPAIYMLRHLGHDGEADRLLNGTAETLEAGARPVALGGDATLDGFCSALEERLKAD